MCCLRENPNAADAVPLPLAGKADMVVALPPFFIGDACKNHTYETSSLLHMWQNALYPIRRSG